MGERADEMSGDPRTRQDDVRGRASEEVAGRASGADSRPADDPERIRTEIERTREDMSETIDEIQDRLSPRNLMSQARETVKEKTVGRVKQAARNVGQSASEWADQTRGAASDVTTSVRQNPWPALLIGGGTAWMLLDNVRRRRRDTEYREYDRGAYGTYAYESAEYSGADQGSESQGVAGEYGTSRMPYDYETTGTRWRGRGQSSMRRGASQFQDLLHRNPLAVSAVAAAIGVAVGLALPETERENRLMGDARDNLLDRAQGAAQSAVEKAKDVAGDAVTKVAKEAAGEAAKKVSEPRGRR